MTRLLGIMFLMFCFHLEGVQFIHQKDVYATHQPVLHEIATSTSGAIIEFGCGNGSTDLLHEICKKNNRILISIDDDYSWLSRYMNKYRGDGYNDDNSGWHKFYFVSGKNPQDPQNPDYWIHFLDNFEPLKTMTFDLCFIDQSPWLARFVTLLRLKEISQYVIVHDCDYFPEKKIFGQTIIPADSKTYREGVYDFSDVFRYFKVYYPLAPWPGFTGPPTLLGSDFESNFPNIDYRQYRDK